MTFSLSEKEKAAFKAWYDVHKDHCAKTVKRKTGQTAEDMMGCKRGPAVRYCFTPNGIGCGIVVECSCGRSIDVTDMDSW